jgi:sec-independent protein translocase protein TatA
MLTGKNMDIGPSELLIILVIVVILFGPGRLANIGGELGKAIHDFREGLRSADNPEEKPKASEPAQSSSSEDTH